MEIKTCSFIEVSDIFLGCPDAWQDFMDSDPPYTWGDAGRTLVSPQSLEYVMELMFSDDEKIARQFELVLNKLKTVDDNVYIDLEN